MKDWYIRLENLTDTQIKYLLTHCDVVHFSEEDLFGTYYGKVDFWYKVSYYDDKKEVFEWEEVLELLVEYYYGNS